MLSAEDFRIQGASKISTWTHLNNLGRNKTLRSSYLWIVIVPLAAKMLSAIESPLELIILNARINLNLSLPFSWQLFYFSSLLIALGSLIYSIFCPDIIKNYDKFSDLTDQGKGGKQIIEYLLEVLPDLKYTRLDNVIDDIVLIEFYEKFTNLGRFTGENKRKITYQTLLNSTINEGKITDCFWWVREVADISSERIRIFCAVSYAIGIFLLGIVLIENIKYVVSQFCI